MQFSFNCERQNNERRHTGRCKHTPNDPCKFLLVEPAGGKHRSQQLWWLWRYTVFHIYICWGCPLSLCLFISHPVKLSLFLTLLSIWSVLDVVYNINIPCLIIMSVTWAVLPNWPAIIHFVTFSDPPPSLMGVCFYPPLFPRSPPKIWHSTRRLSSCNTCSTMLLDSLWANTSQGELCSVCACVHVFHTFTICWDVSTPTRT